MSLTTPSPSGLFDTHLHFFDERYLEDTHWNLEQAMQRANNNQVHFFCNVGTNLKTSKQALATAKAYQRVFATCGYHPTMVDQWNETSPNQLRNLLTNAKVVAIGEIGLDFYHHYTTPTLQKQIFHQQLLIAQQLQKPVLLHIRDAYEETLAIVKQYSVKGIVHCFSGTLVQAETFINLGFYISFSGVLTFDNATNLQNIAKILPLDKIVLETDAPYLTPMPFRGKRNLPEYLLFTAKKLAQIKNLPLATIIAQTTTNAFAALKIPFVQT